MINYRISGTIQFPYREGNANVIYSANIGLYAGEWEATALDPHNNMIASQDGFKSSGEAMEWARDTIAGYWREQEADELEPESWDTLTHNEFTERLKRKLERMSTAELVHLLMEHAWSDLIEEFNNEIIEEWEIAVERAKAARAETT